MKALIRKRLLGELAKQLPPPHARAVVKELDQELVRFELAARIQCCVKAAGTGPVRRGRPLDWPMRDLEARSFEILNGNGIPALRKSKNSTVAMVLEILREAAANTHTDEDSRTNATRTAHERITTLRKLERIGDHRGTDALAAVLSNPRPNPRNVRRLKGR